MMRLGPLALAWLLGMAAMGESARGGEEDPDPGALAARIDRWIADGWRDAQIAPAPPADDATFLRRVRLDLTGTIPTAAEARAFLADPDPAKRAKLIDRLVDSPEFAEHFTDVYTRLIVPEIATDNQVAYVGTVFRAWMRKQLGEGKGWDAIVRAIVTASGPGPGFSNPYDGSQTPSPDVFLMAKKGKPEELGAATARTFLGVRLECAQCHDHPFESWKRERFWEFSAFFAGFQPLPENSSGIPREILGKPELTIPETKIIVKARTLDGAELPIDKKAGPRKALADWLTSRDNPYFARAAANRAWGHLLGTGLVDPVDDFSPSNPPSHPEVLDELARQLADHQFDLKNLIRAIARTQVYQLSSRWDQSSPPDPQLFARMPVKGLTAEQTLRCYVRASGLGLPAEAQNVFFFGATTEAQRFRDAFGRAGVRATESETSILQALHLMNGPLAAQASDPKAEGTLAAVIDAPFLDVAAKVEAMYLATLSRLPRDDERGRLVAHIGAAPDRDAALRNIWWALLNSPEFLVNP